MKIMKIVPKEGKKSKPTVREFNERNTPFFIY